ncbi:MAG TPA: hypothetical protein VMM58_08005 [Bacteroidota bacterium]|nr:hypothetical protein [Bacteroidota bacterium]
MKNLFCTAVASLLFGVGMNSCGPSQEAAAPPPQAPEWVTKPPRDSDALYEVGSAKIDADVIRARRKAEDAARQEIAIILDARVKNVMDRFMQAHTDMINAASLPPDDFTRSVSRSISQSAFETSQIQEIWQDRDNRVIYALAVIAKSDIVKQIKSNVAARCRSVFLEQKADEVLEAMDVALENWDVNR